MLLVSVRLAPAPVTGLAVYATQFIRRGTAVWQFSPGFDLDIDPELVQAQPQILRDRLQHYGHHDRVLQRHILCCDEARHIRHSDAPNLRRWFRGYFFRARHGVDIAMRDIGPGEELSRNWGEHDGRVHAANADDDQGPLRTAAHRGLARGMR